MNKKKSGLIGRIKETRKRQLIRIIAFTAAIMLVSGPLSMNIGENFSSEDMLSTNVVSAADADGSDNTAFAFGTPVVNEVFTDDTNITGKGFFGATVKVIDEAGTEVGTGLVVDDKGNFTVNLQRHLVVDEELDLTQSVDSGGVLNVSNPVALIVQGSDVGDGDSDGDTDGDANGDSDGDTDGDANGDSDGDTDGDANGDSDGDTDGDANGDSDGDADGDADGDSDGDADGDSDGDVDGDSDGDADGDSDGDADGDSDGDADAINYTDAYVGGYLAGFADGEIGCEHNPNSNDEDYVDGYLAGFKDGDSDFDFDRNIFTNGPPRTKAGYVKPGIQECETDPEVEAEQESDNDSHPFGFGGPGDEYGNGPPETKAGYVQVDGPGEGLGGPGEGMDAYGEDIGDQDGSDDKSTVVLGENVTTHIAVGESESMADSSDHELPNTATSTFNWLLGGLMVLIIGAAGLFILRPRKDSVN